MFDPITATPEQLTAQIWHLTEQHGCLMETGHECYLEGNRDGEIDAEEKLAALEDELALIERLDRLCDRDPWLYETSAMHHMRSIAFVAGHHHCDIDTFKRVLITLERQGFALYRKEQLAA